MLSLNVMLHTYTYVYQGMFYLYITCSFRHFWQSIKHHIKFSTKNTAIKTRLYYQENNINRNTDIYINIETK